MAATIAPKKVDQITTRAMTGASARGKAVGVGRQLGAICFMDAVAVTPSPFVPGGGRPTDVMIATFCYESRLETHLRQLSGSWTPSGRSTDSRRCPSWLDAAQSTGGDAPWWPLSRFPGRGSGGSILVSWNAHEPLYSRRRDSDPGVRAFLEATGPTGQDPPKQSDAHRRQINSRRGIHWHDVRCAALRGRPSLHKHVILLVVLGSATPAQRAHAPRAPRPRDVCTRP